VRLYPATFLVGILVASIGLAGCGGAKTSAPTGRYQPPTSLKTPVQSMTFAQARVLLTPAAPRVQSTEALDEKRAGTASGIAACSGSSALDCREVSRRGRPFT
jgi:hypothetical protein